jgi:P27 family predicted phage terminase small subunit
MGKRGPRPDTKAQAEFKGSWRAGKKAPGPQPSPEAPRCPAFLRGEARAEWDRQAVLLAEKDLFSRDYQTALVMYCEAWGEFVDCVHKLQKQGLTTTTDKGNEVQHPLVSIRNRAFDRVMRLGQQFGFTPTAQVDVPAPKKPPGSGVPARKRN